MERITIILVDDHSQVRAQILARLAREPDFQVVGLADTSNGAILTAIATHPKLVLIDPLLGDGQGMDAIREIRTQAPNATIVVLSAFTDTAQKIELESMGVRSILNKGIASHKLLDILRAVASEPSTSKFISLNGKE